MLQLNQDFVDSYGVILKDADKTYVGDNRVKDNKDVFYSPGIAMMKEEASKKVLFGKLYDTQSEYERPYLKLEAVSPYISDNKTKLDLLNTDSNHCIEYKKIKYLANNGKIDEHVMKKLVHPGVLGKHGWRDHTGKSLASMSAFSDIEKLTTLPETYDRASLVEIWSYDYYDMTPYIDLLTETTKKRFDVDIFQTHVDGLIHPYLNTCDIILIKVKGKKK